MATSTTNSRTAMSSSGDMEEPVLFSSVELLSLYATMVLKRLTTTVLPLEEHILPLIKVLEYNLEHMKVERKWFFGTLRDHSRLFHDQWKSHDTDKPDRGMMAYNSLLLVVALRLGMEEMWVTDGCTPIMADILVGLLTALFSPKKPQLGLKRVGRYNPTFDFLADHSQNLEELYLSQSETSFFQRCTRFKTLRVLELGVRIADKVLCSVLWNVNKRSEKVLEMAIKDSREFESLQLALPNLEVLRSTALGVEQHMKITLGAAALIIQPKMETVETLTSWDTGKAVLYILNTEANLRNTTRISRKFCLKRLTLLYNTINMKDVERLFRACPNVSQLALYNTQNISKDISMLVCMIPTKRLKKLTLDATELTSSEFMVLLAEMPNLVELVLEVTPSSIANYQGFSHVTPKEEDIVPPMMPHKVESLTLDFGSSGGDMQEDKLGTEDQFAEHMMGFLANFPAVKKFSLENSFFINSVYLVFGCIGSAVAVLHEMKHLSVSSCDEGMPQGLCHLDDEDGFLTWPMMSSGNIRKHYMKVPLMLPCLQREATFQYMCTLETFELDEFYLSPRVDRMIGAMRTKGVLVNIIYRSGKFRHPISEYSSSKTQLTIEEFSLLAKKFAKTVGLDA